MLMIVFTGHFPLDLHGRSEPPELEFEYIGIEQGMSQNSISSICQDKKGFIWLATEGGVNRYDGYNFKIYASDRDDPSSISHNFVYSIIEDHTGMLWIGTDHGLNKYNPASETFTRFLHDPAVPDSLSNDQVFVVYEDHSGVIWAGTDDGLNRWHSQTGTFTHFKPDLNNPTALSNKAVKAILEDSKGILWIGTDGGLDRLNPGDRGNGAFIHYPANAKNKRAISNGEIKAIYEDRSGTLWIGTRGGGLNRYDRENDGFYAYRWSPDTPGCLSSNDVNVIYEDGAGILWIGTDGGGLNRFDRKKETFDYYLSNKNVFTSLKNNRVRSILEDRGGTMWIGTWAGGLNKCIPGRKKFKKHIVEPRNRMTTNHKIVFALCEDDGDILWIGTMEGLFRYELKTKKNTYYFHDPGNPDSPGESFVRTLLKDRRGDLWIGSQSGKLDKFDRMGGGFIHYSLGPEEPGSSGENGIRSLYEDRSGEFWIGTDGAGLKKLDRDSGKITTYRHVPDEPGSLSYDRIRCIYEAPDETGKYLWIGTFGGGLNRLDRGTGRFTHYKTDRNKPGGIGSDYIYSIYKDPGGISWIGTYDGGLNRYDPETETFLIFDKKNGLPDIAIYSILPDREGYLWCSSNHGLSRFDPRTNSARNYTILDGLQSNEFNAGSYFQCADGKMLFGGINGFNSFYPEEIRDNLHIPQVVITGFQILNKPVPIGKWDGDRVILEKSITETGSIVLSYRDSVFSFEFAALHYVAPRRNRYAYKMEGLEKEWNHVTDRRFVSYTTLPPGDYVFRVKASNSDNIWNETGTAVRIRINPPFWRSRWFLSLSGIFLLFGTWGIYRYRVRQLFNRRKELELLVEERTGELKKLSIVASKTDNVVSIMDEKGRLEWVNEGFKRRYGMDRDQYIKTRGATLTECSENPGIEETLAECLRKKRSVTYETSLETETGRIRWTQTTLTPILDDSGKVVNLVAIDTDITRLKESEKKIWEKSMALEKANEIARRERQAAEFANQSKSEFLARMSHEIRTPMNGVIGFTEMLLDTDLSDVQADYCKTISRSADALVVIINDILDFSKIEAGELTLDAIDFDPELTVFDVCELIRPRLGSKPVEILFRVGDDVPAFVSGDAGRFRQVFVNLMANAAKFTHKGEIEVSLTVTGREQDRLKLLVTVRDTGIGIPKDKLGRIFDVFQQADGSTTRKYGGTGLGLAICLQIARLMGGDIRVESEEGHGSTFYFDAWLGESSKRPKQKFKRRQLEGKRVLIVDDNLKHLDILAHVLEFQEMQVMRESDPRAVIPVIRENFETGRPFDICIMDIEMHGADGFDLAGQIRELEPPISSIPLMAFSSSSIGRSRKYKESGFDGFLPKPLHRRKMYKMVEYLLGNKKGGTPVTRETDIITRHSMVEDAKHAIRILLAEDNPVNQKLARFMLTRAGYKLTTVNNGSEAVETFTAAPGKYDLILMDIQMPEMDGREATRKIRSSGFSKVPIVAMTAEAMKGDRERCIDAGMDDYIAKPIKREVVLEMVSKWVFDRE